MAQHEYHRQEGRSRILFVLSAWSLGVMIDRALMYSAARKQSRVFVQQVAGALQGQTRRSHLHRRAQQEEPHRQGGRHRPFRISIRFLAGRRRGSDRSCQARPRTLRRHRARRNEARPFRPRHHRLDRAVRRTVRHRDRHHQRVQRHFEATKATGLSAVAGGISEALVTTALGLLVAVPAVWAYNYFTNKVEAFDVEMDNSSMELVNYFITRRAAERSKPWHIKAKRGAARWRRRT